MAVTRPTEADNGRRCEVCGSDTTHDNGRCTNNRCRHCHNDFCTPGGNDSPGHGRGVIATPFSPVAIKARDNGRALALSLTFDSLAEVRDYFLARPDEADRLADVTLTRGYLLDGSEAALAKAEMCLNRLDAYFYNLYNDGAALADAEYDCLKIVGAARAALRRMK